MNEPELQIVGGLQGDPAAYIFFRTSGEGILSDLGSIEQLTQRDLMKVRCVFISHAHMDHFMGFDRWLRVNVPHKRLLKIWGPAPFFERVQAKLRAYTWNLIDEDQLRFEVHEIQDDGRVRVALLTNGDDFAIQVKDEGASQKHLTTLQDGSRVSCVGLDHKGIRSIAYKVKAPDKLKLRNDRLQALGLRPGPWISELQLRARQGQLEGEMEVEGRSFSRQELARELLQWEAGFAVGYCTDLSFDRLNLQRLDELRPLQRLISESSFKDEDWVRAVAKAHLTTRQASLIASHLGVRDLHIFHISTIYGQGPDAVLEEANGFFAELSAASEEEKKKALADELTRVESLLLA